MSRTRWQSQKIWIFVTLGFLGYPMGVLYVLKNRDYTIENEPQRTFRTNLGEKLPQKLFVEVPKCHCLLNITGNGSSENVEFSDTTCSAVAYARGSGQKIVGFSFYGNSKSEKHQGKKYFEGIVNNLKAMETYYPGWIMRSVAYMFIHRLSY